MKTNSKKNESKSKNKTKFFEMNDDYAELDELSTLGLVESEDIDKLIFETPQNSVASEKTSDKSELPAETTPQSEDESKASSIPANLGNEVSEVVQGLRGIRSGGQVYMVDVRRLQPYPNQPFQQYPLERLQELAEDILRVGILSPILTRRQGSWLQILAGHNRWSAAKLAGLTEVPVMVLDADDDRAVLVLTSTNLRQREKLLPSEKAFAYKMQMEALKRQGQRGGGLYDASAFITQQTGDSRMQIHRFVRLCELEEGLLTLLDRGKISMTPAVAVSYLHRESQRHLLEIVKDFDVTLTIDRANRLKNAAGEREDGLVSLDAVEEIMLNIGKKRERKEDFFHISSSRLQEFLPLGISDAEAEELIIKGLKALRNADGVINEN